MKISVTYEQQKNPLDRKLFMIVYTKISNFQIYLRVKNFFKTCENWQRVNKPVDIPIQGKNDFHQIQFPSQSNIILKQDCNINKSVNDISIQLNYAHSWQQQEIQQKTETQHNSDMFSSQDSVKFMSLSKSQINESKQTNNETLHIQITRKPPIENDALKSNFPQHSIDFDQPFI